LTIKTVQFKEIGMRKTQDSSDRDDSSFKYELRAINKELIASRNTNLAELPPGWHKLYRQTLDRFARVTTHDRAPALRRLTINTDGAFMRVELPTSDRVLLGIARRCNDRSRWTCRHCGRAGRVRSFGAEHEEVLCPRCAAPKLVRRGIDDVLHIGAMTGRLCSPVLAKHMPEILRPNFLENARLASATKSERSINEDAGMNKDQFSAWLKWLGTINGSVEAI
jgi:hypothetical protein